MKKTINLIVLFILIFGNSIAQKSQISFDEITSFIEKEKVTSNIPSVVVGITSFDSLLYLQSFGNAQKDDLFLIGSNSKSFTALAILILEQKGLLNIDDKVKKHLPWFKYSNTELSDRVIIKDLLNQTSGILRKYGMYDPKKKKDVISFYKKILNKIPHKEINYGNYTYSNINYQLLGLIIEKVSNQKYADFIEKEIIQKIEMHHSSANLKRTKEIGLIDSYQYLLYYPILKEKIYYNDYIVSSGFISSSAKDMCTYLRAFMNSQDTILIHSQIKEKLFTPRKDINSVYGMGWENRNWKEYDRMKHDGLTQSFASSMLILPELNIGIVILANCNNSPATLNMADGILRIITNKEKITYSKSGFYMRNSIFLFALWILILTIFRIKKWISLGFPIGFSRKIIPNLFLTSGITFGLFFILYIPNAFNTPLPAIIDYEPNSGWSLLILSVGICLSSLLNYFNRNKTQTIN